jgi:hypothetical protein
MPVVNGTDLARLRATRHTTELALNVYAPPTIWTARIDGAQTNGALAVIVKTVSQVRAPSKNMQVWFGTTAGGNELGEARFKSYGAPTLHVSTHQADLPDNGYVTVKEVVQPQAVHVGIVYGVGFALDTLFEDEDIAYSDQDYIPLARCGTHCVIYRDAITGLATGKFYSRSTGIGGATLSTHTWYWRGGTVTVGSTATAGTSGAPNQVTWNTTGDYYCSLTVTDSNGKTHTRFFVVFVRDLVDAVSFKQLELSAIECDEQGVWQTTLTVHAAANLIAFPKNALCVLSAKDTFGSEAVSIGNELYRENIVLVGYIKSDSVKQDWEKGTVEFTVINLAGMLQTQGQIAGDLEDSVESPTTVDPWHQLLGMTYNLAVHHVLVWHSTASQLGDVYLNLPALTALYATLPEGSLADQLTPLCTTVSGRWGGTAQGHLYFEPHPQLTPVTGRSTAYVIDQQLVDLRGEIDFGQEEQTKRVSRVDFWGEDAAGEPFGSWAPAREWSTGMPEKVEGIRVNDQNHCNQMAGLYEAYHNLNYQEVILPWRGNYRIFDVFPAEPIAVTAPSNKRGIAWASQRCWLKHVSYDLSKISQGILLVTVTCEMDVSGSLGTTYYEPPYGEVSPYPVSIPVIPSFPPLNWGGVPFPFPGGPSIPPLSALGTYDFVDGIAETVAAGTTQPMLVGLPRRCRLVWLSLFCAEDDITFSVFVDGQANACLICTHNTAWTIERHNGLTGALISTWTGAASSYAIQHILSGANAVTLYGSGLFRTQLVTGANPTSLFAYGIGGASF